MARRFAKVSEEEIEEAFCYPSDLVNTNNGRLTAVDIYLRGIVVYYFYNKEKYGFGQVLTPTHPCYIYRLKIINNNCIKFKLVSKPLQAKKKTPCINHQYSLRSLLV